MMNEKGSKPNGDSNGRSGSTGAATPSLDGDTKSVATGGNIEHVFAQVLAEVLKVETVETGKHFFDELGADSMTMARFCARLRKRDDIPNVSMKEVYGAPTIARLASAVAPAPSPSMEQSTGSGANIEHIFAQVLAEVIKVETVATNKHFFDELGADSMTMARFCARLRKRDDIPNVSMKEVYGAPTIAQLAAVVTPAPSPSAEQSTGSGTDIERIFAQMLAEILKVETVETAKHFFDELGADSMTMARFCARVRKRGDVPNVSMKEVYGAPTIAQLAAAVTPVPSPSVEQSSGSGADIEHIFAQVLAEVLKVETVATDKHFFDELGVDSMTMARFCARVRKRTDAPNISMKEVYANPTLARLAAIGAASNAFVPDSSQPRMSAEAKKPATDREVAICGALQLAASFVYAYLIALVLTLGYRWVVDGAGYGETYARAVIFSGGSFVLLSVLPILAKWALVGRWTARQFRIWSLDYVRFWIVKTLVRSNPLVLFAGTPIYNAYLRTLGAKIGRNVEIYSPHVPVCTDLLSIGDNAIVRKDTYFSCYRAHAGLIQTGPVTLGKNSFIGEMTVLDIDTFVGDGAQIGHTSALYAGQSIPAGEHRQGSPAQHQTTTDYRDVPAMKCGTVRKVIYSLITLLPMLLVLSISFSAIILLVYLLTDRPHFAQQGSMPFAHWGLYVDALLVSAVLFLVSLVSALVFIGTVPRILNRALEPGKVYPLYGLHYWIHRQISTLTNVKFFTFLFGDSSYIVKYLQWIGYDFPNVVQTGSNFGLNLKHDNPFLVTIGSGTVVADGLSAINNDYSSTSFRVSRVTIGCDNFLGNNIAYPAKGKTGDNCLLATKVLVPLEGDVREGVGLLGSPSFNIPRTVARDRDLELNDEDEQARKLVAKDRHNLATMGLFLAARWFEMFLMTCLGFTVAKFFVKLDAPIAALIVAIVGLFAIALRIGYRILIERLSTRFQSLKPRECSIYDPYFWFHERYWKLMAGSHLLPLDGTPFKAFAWRLHGMKIGKRVFDDGCDVSERTMVAIGDDCTLNIGSIIQSHSQEDGGFKSDHIEIGANCTLGVGSWVHYGAKLGDGSELAVNAFLMKGEEVLAHTVWGDNPASEISKVTSSTAPSIAQ